MVDGEWCLMCVCVFGLVWFGSVRYYHHRTSFFFLLKPSKIIFTDYTWSFSLFLYLIINLFIFSFLHVSETSSFFGVVAVLLMFIFYQSGFSDLFFGKDFILFHFLLKGIWWWSSSSMMMIMIGTLFKVIHYDDIFLLTSVYINLIGWLDDWPPYLTWHYFLMLLLTPLSNIK